eukprot:1244942-Rhodomonas_salina.2
MLHATTREEANDGGEREDGSVREEGRAEATTPSLATPFCALIQKLDCIRWSVASSCAVQSMAKRRKGVCGNCRGDDAP